MGKAFREMREKLKTQAGDRRTNDKANLHLVPPRTELIQFVLGKQLSGLIVLRLLILHEVPSSFHRPSGGGFTSRLPVSIRLATIRLATIRLAAIHLDIRRLIDYF